MAVQKCLLIQRSLLGNQEPPSPAQMQEMYAVFNAWKPLLLLACPKRMRSSKRDCRIA
jgi:hypothetical protein